MVLSLAAAKEVYGLISKYSRCLYIWISRCRDYMLFKKGKKPYKEILAYQSTASDIIGVIVVIAIGAIIYFVNK